MPEKSGFEVCREIKSDSAVQDIPIIFITVKSDEESIEKAYDAGGADYVIKPFRSRELMARVKLQLELKDKIIALDYDLEACIAYNFFYYKTQ